MSVIAIANQKGGVGKTTLNVNLAGIMSHFGFSTLIIDADPQCNSTSYFIDPNLPEDETLAEIYNKPIDDDVFLKLIHPTRLANLYIIPGGFSLSARVWEIVQDETSGLRIKTLVDTLQKKRHFDFIFIDCPPDVGIFTIGAFFASDYVIIPIQPERLSVEGVAQLMEKIHQFWEMRKEDKPQILGAVTTMFQGTNKSHKDWAEQIEKICGDSLLGLVHRSSLVSTACDAGMLLMEDRPNKRGRPYQQHLTLAKRILTNLGISPQNRL